MIRAAFYIIHVLLGCSIIFIGDGSLMWITDAILVTFPAYYILLSMIWGTLATLISVKSEKRLHDKKHFIKTWFLMMLSIHWITVVLLLVDTFNIFSEIDKLIP